MQYINEIQINDAIIHILDSSANEPIFNNFRLDLNEEIYKFILRHVERCLKDEELRYAKFNDERNVVKETSTSYLNGSEDFLGASKEIARQMFVLIKGNSKIPSCDLLIVSISTEHGPMLGILKMDYIKNYTHNIEFVDEKIGINIVPQFTGLPSSSQKIMKCAFIKPIREEDGFNLMIIDKTPKKNEEDYGSNYFVNKFLGCSIVENERDMTKSFVKAVEEWTRSTFKEDAASGEEIRRNVKKKLKEEDTIKVEEVSTELFKESPHIKQSFDEFTNAYGVNSEVQVDKNWVEKKLKKVRIKIDKDIDLYIPEEIYQDNEKFEVEKIGGGRINIIIKNVVNYIEK